MVWTDIIAYIMYGCGGVILILFVTNLVLTYKRGNDSVWVRRALYIIALIAVVLSIIRSISVYSETVVFANVLVLLCLIVSFIRSGRPPKDPDEESEEEE